MEVVVQTDTVKLDAETGMGNETSRSHALEQDLGVTGQTSQFHKVLVEPEYSELEPTAFTVTVPEPSVSGTVTCDAIEDIHSQDTLRIGDKPDKIAADDVTDKADDKKDDSDGSACVAGIDDDYSLIEECKALITESADRVIARSISREDKPKTEVEIKPEIQIESNKPEGQFKLETEQLTIASDIALKKEDQIECETIKNNQTVLLQSVQESEVVAPSVIAIETPKVETENNNFPGENDSLSEELKREAKLIVEESIASAKEIVNKENKSDSKTKAQQKEEQEKKEREIIESVQEHINIPDTVPKEKKRSIGSSILGMFKFSKRKSKDISNDSLTDKTEDQNGKINVTMNGDLNTVAYNGTAGTSEKKLIDYVEEKTNVFLHSAKTSTSSEPDLKANGSPQSQSNGSLDVEYINTSDVNDAISRVKRLNSLDSGIVVEKVNEQQVETVEYSVVQKKSNNDSKIKPTADKLTPDIETKQLHITNNGSQVQKQPEALLNGDKEDEDFVYINERPIDIDGLNASVQNQIKTQLNDRLLSVEAEDKDKKTELNKPELDSISTGTNSDSQTNVQRSDQVKPPEFAKLKKKSWSFQFGKKKAESLDGETGLSMDPNASTQETEVKKPKWRLGKFSFRRSNPNVSASTPNLDKVGIPEESEVATSSKSDQKDAKKGTKLKKIKAKKEKKLKEKESKSKEDGSVTSRSNSLLNVVLGDTNTPRSRRSIVEDDIDYQETDVFDDCSLSDLSLDGDVQVSSKQDGPDIVLEKGKYSGNNKKSKSKTKKGNKTSDQSLNISAPEMPAVGVEYAQVNKVKAEKVEENTALPAIIDATKLSTDAEPDNEYAQIVKNKNNFTEELKQKLRKGPRIIAEAEVVDAAKIAQITFDPPQNAVAVDIGKADIANEAEATSEVHIETIESFDVNVLNSTPVSVTCENNIETPDQNSSAKDIAYSNMIYGDDSIQDTIKEIIEAKETTEQKAAVDDTDSDAYVQLEQIVKDHKVETFSKPALASLLTKLEKSTEMNSKENVPSLVDSPKTPVAVSPTLPKHVQTVIDTPETPITISPTLAEETEEDYVNVVKMNVKPKVIIMKEVGIQAPDIYMPLDIDRDFGFVKNKVACFSIGTQVTEDDVEEKGDKKEDNHSITMATAYF